MTVGKIHIAPCSCELHVRIRELEAELAEMRQWETEAYERVKDIEFYKARAEKAEREALAEAEAHRDYLERWNLAEAAARAEANAAQVHFEARQRLEARVAELERERERDAGTKNRCGPVHRGTMNDPCHTGSIRI